MIARTPVMMVLAATLAFASCKKCPTCEVTYEEFVDGEQTEKESETMKNCDYEQEDDVVRTYELVDGVEMVSKTTYECEDEF